MDMTCTMLISWIISHRTGTVQIRVSKSRGPVFPAVVRCLQFGKVNVNRGEKVSGKFYRGIFLLNIWIRNGLRIQSKRDVNSSLTATQADLWFHARILILKITDLSFSRGGTYLGRAICGCALKILILESSWTGCDFVCKLFQEFVSTPHRTIEEFAREVRKVSDLTKIQDIFSEMFLYFST